MQAQPQPLARSAVALLALCALAACRAEPTPPPAQSGSTAAGATAATATTPAATTPAGIVVDGFPTTPDPGARYVVYLHGRIIEDQGRAATSPEFGRYELDAILRALARPGVVVVGEVRPQGADPAAAAAHVVTELRRLREAGVPAASLAVVGASKGGLIAMLASTQHADRDTAWVLMGNCNQWVRDHYDVRLHGRVLSIHEASDDVGGSCEPIFAASPELAARREIRLTTGRGHGFLYQPLAEWVEPAVEWIAAGHGG